MIGLGLGEIVGSIVFGKLGDKVSMRTLITTNIFVAIVAFSITIWYTIRFDFSLQRALLMTFMFGFSDGGLNTLLNSVLGFEFDSKTAPFGVKAVVQHLICFIIIIFESFLGSQKSYLFYFVIEMIFCILAWLVFKISFEFRNESIYE